MTAYFWGALAIIAIGALIALVVYATKAGRNAQSVTTDKAAVADAQTVTATTEAMSKAQAEGPQSKGQLLARLDAGEG
ncbi:MAG: hypothetical protein ABF646_02295 [Acetobacter papayae]